MSLFFQPEDETLEVELAQLRAEYAVLLADRDAAVRRAEAAEAKCEGMVPEARVEKLLEALRRYAECSDGCTCGDGWSHTAARQALIGFGTEPKPAK